MPGLYLLKEWVRKEKCSGGGQQGSGWRPGLVLPAHPLPGNRSALQSNYLIRVAVDQCSQCLQLENLVKSPARHPGGLRIWNAG